MPSFIDRFMNRVRSAPPTKTIGQGGVAIYSGYIQEEERNRDLVGREKYRTFSSILANTSVASAGVRYFLNLVAKPTWKAEPADDSPAAAEIAEKIEAALYGMTTPWHKVVRRAAMYRFFGFSVQEWTAKRAPDGSLALLDIEPRPQMTIERWDVDVTGTVHGMIQRPPMARDEIYLPRMKTLYLVDDTLHDSPEGLGLLRHVAPHAKRLSRYEQLEGFGFETDLRGIPIGRAPFSELLRMEKDGTITPAQRTQIEKPLKDFVQNHFKSPELGILLDSMTYQSLDEAGTPSSVRQWDVGLMGADGQSSFEDAHRAIERLNREIARILGVEALLLGGDGKGSLALSREKTQQLALVVDSTLGELAESVESDVVATLMRLNGWDEALAPTLKTESVQFRDVEQLTGALADMAQSGAVLAPDDPVIGEVRDLLGLSRPPDPIDLDADPGRTETRDDPDPAASEDDLEVEEEDET